MNVMVIQETGRKIKIEEQILETIQSYLQTSITRGESGGILIGREEIASGNLIIDHCTAPMARDKSSRFRFTRKDTEHITYYEKLNDPNPIYAYVGEWHTHPEAVPHYSCIDENNWETICKDEKTPEVQYHLIAGTTAFRVWRCSSSGKNIELICTATWEK